MTLTNGEDPRRKRKGNQEVGDNKSNTTPATQPEVLGQRGHLQDVLAEAASRGQKHRQKEEEAATLEAHKVCSLDGATSVTRPRARKSKLVLTLLHDQPYRLVEY